MTGRLVLPDEGLPDLIRYLLGKTTFPGTPWYLILYRTPVDPTHSTVWSDLTECSFGGYVRITVDPTLWQTPVVTGGVAGMKWDTKPYAWTNTGASQQVAGYAYIRASSPILYGIQELATPITLLNLQTLPLWPVWTLTTDTCTV